MARTAPCNYLRQHKILMLVMICITPVACSPESFIATTDSVVGNYVAMTFVTSENAVATDQLSRGATLEMNLNADGTTTGRLFIPSGTSELDFEADLSGTWTLNGNTVQFDQNADTFVRDLPFTVERNRLRGEGVFAGVMVRVVLKKQ